MNAPGAFGVICACVLALGIASCDQYPRDPENTSHRVSNAVLRVGVSQDPPFVELQAGRSPTGVDVEVLRAFAASKHAHIEFVVDGHADLMASLEDFKLDAVAGGHSEKTPWAGHVALSAPFDVRTSEGRLSRRVVALPPGENAWAMQFDRFVASERGVAVRGVGSGR